MNAKKPTRNRSATRSWPYSRLANANRPKFQFTVNQDTFAHNVVSNAFRKYTASFENNGDFLMSAMSIKIVHESSADDSEYERARNLIRKADKIIFLGGFWGK